MLIIREVFTAKPGMAGKLARLFKKMMKNYPGTRVMTDMVGNYNTVIMEMEVNSLAEFEKAMEDMKSGKPDPYANPEITEEEMSSYKDMYLYGRREVFRVE